MVNSTVRPCVVAVLGMVALGGAIDSPAASSGAARQESADAHIVAVVAITRVYADGLKVPAVAIQYDRKIKDVSLQPTDFTVETSAPGQKITQVYTSNDGLQTTRHGLNGSYVIVELSTDQIIPVAAHKVPASPPAGPRPPAPAQMPAAAKPEAAKPELALNSEVIAKVGNISWDPTAHPATLKSSKHGGNGESVSINQVGEITTTDGLTLTATSAARDNVYLRNLVVDGFMKPDFTTGAHGNVKYNIHFPKNFDANRKYPVVVFLDDSDSPNGYTHAEYLIHGQGGVVWADQEDESRHPAIVVVPALSRPLINNSYEPTVETRPGGQTSTPYLSILDLMDGLLDQIPNADKSRVYLTGQGDGARAALSMLADRPNLYAAALLLAPDYDAGKAAPLSKAKMWIVTAEGDEASHASMESFIAGLQAGGARVGRAEWNGRASAAQLAAQVHDLAAQGKNIEYTVLKRGTVVAPGVADDAVNNHAYTWRVGYSIQPLRDWLFTQHN